MHLVRVIAKAYTVVGTCTKKSRRRDWYFFAASKTSVKFLCDNLPELGHQPNMQSHCNLWKAPPLLSSNGAIRCKGDSPRCGLAGIKFAIRSKKTRAEHGKLLIEPLLFSVVSLGCSKALLKQANDVEWDSDHGTASNLRHVHKVASTLTWTRPMPTQTSWRSFGPLGGLVCEETVNLDNWDVLGVGANSQKLLMASCALVWRQGYRQIGSYIDSSAWCPCWLQSLHYGLIFSEINWKKASSDVHQGHNEHRHPNFLPGSWHFCLLNVAS